MLNIFARVHVARVTEPVGRWLVGHGVAPDVVTVAGTVGSVAAALVVPAPRPAVRSAPLVITVFVLFDLLDGAMARARGAHHGVRRGARLHLRPARRRRAVRGAHLVVPRASGTSACSGSPR